MGACCTSFGAWTELSVQETAAGASASWAQPGAIDATSPGCFAPSGMATSSLEAVECRFATSPRLISATTRADLHNNNTWETATSRCQWIALREYDESGQHTLIHLPVEHRLKLANPHNAFINRPE